VERIDFVNRFVTLDRLERGIEEVCGENTPDIRQTGEFVKWISNEVRREAQAELEAAGLKWKDVSKATVSAARQWWMIRCGR
jgi:hypothetical protein